MPTIAEALAQAQKSYEIGDIALAERLCRQILGVNSRQPAAWFLLAAACEKQSRFAEAATHYQQVVNLLPDCAEAHAGLGNTFAQQRRLADAEASYREALRICPTDAQTPYNLAVVLRQQGKTEEAITYYRQAVQGDAQNMEALNNLGNALRQEGQFEEAAYFQKQALQLQPQSPTIINNLAATLLDLGKLDDAIAYFQQALRINPGLVECYNNIGQARKQQGRLDEAMANFEQALRIDPNHSAARWNRALLWLLRGEWQRGWSEYEWRWQQPGRSHPQWPQPRWDGSRLDGRTIMLFAEQGLGDTIQFIRYAALVKERGGKVLVECPPVLMRLLAKVRGIDQFLASGSALPPFDVQAHLLSLPGILGTSIATIPAEIPYLSADTELVAHWRGLMEPLWGFKIGIAWQGNPRFCDDRLRSIPLAQFAALSAINGVRLVNLQKGPGIDQLQGLAGNDQIIDLGRSLDEANGPFMDTAAIMKHLDLVICSDSAVAHLAGALGVPVWLALPLTPDWRWLLQRDDSPWYPSMRLFRQTRFGDWDGVFGRIIAEVKTLVPRVRGRGGHMGQTQSRMRLFSQGSSVVATVAETFQHAWNCHEAGDFLRAEQLYRQVLQLDPAHADAWCFLGAVCQSLGKLSEAESCQRRALEIVPGYPTARKCLGIAVAHQGRLEEAGVIFTAMLRDNAEDAEVFNNLGLVRAQQGRWEEALAYYGQAIALRPDYGESHWNRALVWLVQGKFEEGWREYEWRWKQPNFKERHFSQPMWDGSPLDGRTILLYGEQGLGDAIQFIRYAPLVAERGGKVIVECHAALMKLFAGLQGIYHLLPFGAALPAFDVQAPLCSMPFVFGTTLTNVPAAVPYVHAEPSLAEHWRRELAHYAPLPASGRGVGGEGKIKIGIAWQGNPTFRDDRARSIPLTHFAPLAALPGIQLISLQKGPGVERLADIKGRFPVLDLSDRLDEASGPFMDTAAIMKNVDLVISSDTAIPHLAGALGVPVWMALSHVPDWRWLLQREDSPWYPTMRLYRQTRAGDWNGVFQRMAGDLQALAAKP